MSGLHSALLLLSCAGMIYLDDCQDDQSKPPTDPGCSYSVKPIQFGFQIKLAYSAPGNYTMNYTIAEKESSFERKATSFLHNKTSTWEIKPLKPCTEYELNVILINNYTTKLCNNTENKTSTTMEMTQRDITNISCPSGYFCYQSGWNISSLLSGNNVSDVQFINGSYRIKPAYESICSELVLEFPQEKCSNITFNKTENVPFVFIDVNDVFQPEPTELPAEIKSKLPPNCQDLSVVYNCSGMNNNSIDPSDMKPFTDYSCTGDIKSKNGSIIKTLPPVQFNVDCDFSISFLQKIPTNTSIKLNWEPTSNECGGILDQLTELSYSCSCQQGWKHEHDAIKGEVDQRTCNINGLEPFKDYTCKVHVIYNKTRMFKDTIENVKTGPGSK
ncbi:uncharacterized protein LOC108166217 [Poecilia reticulata]|uniref:uncharacterized protein LOC108166217 n=1 Tax=Poecilia reticulata TaxID=8081 RepID=UPI0007EA680A|nr:PREDICTED: uncharacterized protein LOC108166217 [Poecilia reticulata]